MSVGTELSAGEAAAMIPHGSTVAFSGFTAAGAAKAVPRALAARAEAEHQAGRPFRLRVLAGASTGASVDETLARANAIAFRAPYQSSKTLRQQINRGEVEFVDMHLSHVAQQLGQGVYGTIDWAVIEATELTHDGKLYPTTSIGLSPTFCDLAARVVVELNQAHHPRLREMADIVTLPPPPHRGVIPIEQPLTKIGQPYIQVDPAKIVGVVRTNEPDEAVDLAPPDEVCRQIARHLVTFLLEQMAQGRLPADLPLQSGVGNVANAVLGELGESPDFPPFLMYTEVYQDALIELMRRGRCLGASASALAVSKAGLRTIYDEIDFFAPRIVLRPQEISNHPAVARQLGVIAMNTALEVDLYGHVNSTHVHGTDLMNGIGGSGDFERNAFLSFFMCPSVAKGGRISAIVPMCSHVDHNEHSVQIVVTEYGLADLRGVAPERRAELLIERCAHPAYRDYLRGYLAGARVGHLRHDLDRAFELHRNLIEHGAMLPGLTLSEAAS